MSNINSKVPGDPMEGAVDNFVQMCRNTKLPMTAAENKAFLLDLAEKMYRKASDLRKQANGDMNRSNEECSSIITVPGAAPKEDEVTIIFRPYSCQSSVIHEARYDVPLWENFVVIASVYAEDQGLEYRTLHFVGADGREISPGKTLKELGFTDDKELVHVSINGGGGNNSGDGQKPKKNDQ